MGFDKQVLAAKASLQLTDEGGEANLGQRKQRVALTSGWGHQRAAKRLRGDNPTALTDRDRPV
ncbi:MAG: hypothetical protein L0312_19910 [Acidobacteria bacterium]|nr:hypothetical protein [Acidobacteriota bacterium]